MDKIEELVSTGIDVDEATAMARATHTVMGKTSEDGWPYGTTHDYDCPGCQDTPFLISPRSETYWSS